MLCHAKCFAHSLNCDWFSSGSSLDESSLRRGYNRILRPTFLINLFTYSPDNLALLRNCYTSVLSRRVCKSTSLVALSTHSWLRSPIVIKSIRTPCLLYRHHEVQFSLKLVRFVIKALGGKTWHQDSVCSGGDRGIVEILEVLGMWREDNVLKTSERQEIRELGTYFVLSYYGLQPIVPQ